MLQNEAGDEREGDALDRLREKEPPAPGDDVDLGIRRRQKAPGKRIADHERD